jgi:hypothetical protein
MGSAYPLMDTCALAGSSEAKAVTVGAPSAIAHFIFDAYHPYCNGLQKIINFLTASANEICGMGRHMFPFRSIVPENVDKQAALDSDARSGAPAFRRRFGRGEYGTPLLASYGIRERAAGSRRWPASLSRMASGPYAGWINA